MVCRQGGCRDLPTAWHTGEAAIFSIEAITDMMVYEVPFDDMKGLLARCSELRDWEVKVLMEQLYVLERRYVILGTGDARSRYEALLNGRPQEILNAIPPETHRPVSQNHPGNPVTGKEGLWPLLTEPRHQTAPAGIMSQIPPIIWRFVKFIDSYQKIHQPFFDTFGD